MKTAVTVTCLTLLAGGAFAGSPEVPGQNGDFVDFAKDYWQGAADHPSGWGKIVSAESRGVGPLGLGKLGGFLKNGPLTADGRPDPGNDNGAGND